MFGWGKSKSLEGAMLFSVLTTLTGESHDAYNQVYSDQQPNEGQFSHELVAGGASFAAFKIFEDRQRAEGKHEH